MKKDGAGKSLPVCVRKNLYRLRKVLKLKQEDFANALGLKRTGYTKKETGITPITLDDLDAILNGFPNISLEDLLLGCLTFGHLQDNAGLRLSVETRKRFPFLEQIVLAANQAVDSVDEKEDLRFMRQCLEYAIRKVPEENLN